MSNKIRLTFTLLPLTLMGLFLAGVIGLLTTRAAQAATCDVPTGSHPTIQSAADDVSCDTVNLTAPLYYENVTITRSITIQGQSPLSTAVDGNANGSVFTIQPGLTVSLTKLTITHGEAERGGGIHTISSTVALDSVAIISNTSIGFDPNGGGGIRNDGGMVTIKDSLLSENYAERNGGALYSTGALTLTYTTISHNSGRRGPGIYNLGTLALDQCLVQHNRGVYWRFPEAIFSDDRLATINFSIITHNDGGGMSGNLDLNSSTISHNTGEGRGLELGDGSINNSTISGNGTDGDGGGGLNISFGTVHINNSTITENYGRSGTGGISAESAFNVYLQNTILAGNKNIDTDSSSDCSGPVKSNGFNLIGTTAGCNYSPAAGDLIGISAELNPLEGSPGFHRPKPNSPVIDAGNPDGCTDEYGTPLNTDQRGMSRTGRCDIGAIETQPLETSDKVVRPNFATPGSSVNYLITLRNTGIADLSPVTVSDTFPASLTYVTGSLSASSGAYQFDNGVINWSGVVSQSEEVQISYEATVHPSTPFGGTIVNTAVISSGGHALGRSANLSLNQYLFLPAILRDHRWPDFFDGFCDPSSGWFVGEDDFVRSEYLDCEFRILTKKTDQFYMYRAPTPPLQDYVVEVDARWAGSPGEYYGLVFGINADFSQYLLLIVDTQNLQWELQRYPPGGINFSGSTSAINPGAGTNHIKVHVSYGLLRPEINGEVLANLGWSSGLTGVGLVSKPYDNQPISDARFDNYSLTDISTP